MQQQAWGTGPSPVTPIHPVKTKQSSSPQSDSRHLSSSPSSKLSLGLRQSNLSSSNSSSITNGIQKQQQQQQQSQSQSASSPSGSGALTPTKNLSHVPCKFYRQGACQAGNACPFSHSMDVVDQAPCKYFQKGNCKFGLKCALAHITPDGRRINRPSNQNNQHQNHNQNQNQNGNGNSNSSVNSNNNSPQVLAQGHLQSQQQQHIINHSPLSHPVSSSPGSVSHQRTWSYTNQPSSLSVALNSSNSSNSYSLGLATGSLIAAASTAIPPTSPYSKSANPFSSGLTNNITNNRSMSASSTSLWTDRPFIRSLRTSSSLFADNDSAIADDLDELNSGHNSLSAIDDDDDNDDDDSNTINGNPFEEDFVPSSLKDLLTPQERQRKSSRVSMSYSNKPIDIWASPRYPRQSFSESHNSSLKVLQPIGTPERTSHMSSISSSIGDLSKSLHQQSHHHFDDILSPPPPRRDPTPINNNILTTSTTTNSSNSLFDDDLEDTQFVLEQEDERVDHHTTRLQNLRLMDG